MAKVMHEMHEVKIMRFLKALFIFISIVCMTFCYKAQDSTWLISLFVFNLNIIPDLADSFYEKSQFEKKSLKIILFSINLYFLLLAIFFVVVSIANLKDFDSSIINIFGMTTKKLNIFFWSFVAFLGFRLALPKLINIKL